MAGTHQRFHADGSTAERGDEQKAEAERYGDFATILNRPDMSTRDVRDVIRDGHLAAGDECRPRRKQSHQHQRSADAFNHSRRRQKRCERNRPSTKCIEEPGQSMA